MGQGAQGPPDVHVRLPPGHLFPAYHFRGEQLRCSQPGAGLQALAAPVFVPFGYVLPLRSPAQALGVACGPQLTLWGEADSKTLSSDP